MGRVPATATLTVQRHDLSLALLPGVTGRLDVFAERREEVLAALRPALEAVLVPGGTVTVVAPALQTRTTTGAQPDLGASGYLAGPAVPASPALAALDAISDEPALHVTASAAVALLRLAGWTWEITTHEIGAEAGVSAQTVTGGSAPTAPTASSDLAAIAHPALVGPHLVLFACARPDGVLPVGAPAALALAEERTHALYHEVLRELAGVS